jgi:hypothetical protein
MLGARLHPRHGMAGNRPYFLKKPSKFQDVIFCVILHLPPVPFPTNKPHIQVPAEPHSSLPHLVQINYSSSPLPFYGPPAVSESCRCRTVVFAYRGRRRHLFVRSQSDVTTFCAVNSIQRSENVKRISTLPSTLDIIVIWNPSPASHSHRVLTTAAALEVSAGEIDLNLSGAGCRVATCCSRAHAIIFPTSTAELTFPSTAALNPSFLSFLALARQLHIRPRRRRVYHRPRRGTLCVEGGGVGVSQN